jgi:predicted DNA-binding protein (MmcQ/YjbR family)
MAMEYQILESHLLSKKGSFKDFPFGPNAAVFKVAGKMFALVALNEKSLRITLKCDPDDADALRMMFDAVKPGYAMNKDHWNTIHLDGSIPEDILLNMIDASYCLVVNKLRKEDRSKLENP